MQPRGQPGLGENVRFILGLSFEWCYEEEQSHLAAQNGAGEPRGCGA